MNNQPIRVLQMIASLTRGGSQSVVMNLYRNIDRNKVQFDFIIDHPEYSGYEDEIKELGGKIYIMPPFKGTNYFEVKKAWNDFFKEHKEYKILHSHSRSYASIYFPIAKKYGIKTIIHSHSTGNGYGIKAVIKDIMQLPLRHQADYFMACSLDSGRWLFGNKIIKSNKFYLLNNAVDSKRFAYNEKIRKEYRDNFSIGNENVFIQVGNFVVEKNHLFILEVFSELLKTKPNNLFYIVGSGTQKDIKGISDKINELNLNNNVVMLGTRDDVPNLLQMADCYLMPSVFEGLSLAAIEAQASGIMCLLSDTVSSDVKISDVCQFLPLKKDVWIEKMSIDKFERKNTYDDIVKSGYDINTTSTWLKDFYWRIINE